MRNNLDYDYHKMTYPNLLRQVDKGVGEGRLDFVVEPMLLTLLERVARKNPRWQVIISTPKHSLVYENKELIGKVQLASQWNVTLGSHTVYEISGPRVGREMERKDARHTTQVNRAMQLIKKLFGAQTPKEIVEATAPKALSELSVLVHRKISEQSYIRTKIINHLAPLLKTHWSLVRSTVVQGGMPPRDVDNFEGRAEEAAKLKDMKQRVETVGRAAVAIAHKEGYLIKDVGVDTPAAYVDDTHDASILTPTMRKNIGMLKLVKEKEAVTGVGFRAEAGVFVVFKEDEENDGET